MGVSMSRLMKFQKHSLSQGKITSQDFELMQQNIEQSVNGLLDKKQMNSQLLENQSLTIGIENWVEHGLGRDLIGWKITDVDTMAMIWRVATSTADTTKYLPLAVSASCTIDIEVF